MKKKPITHFMIFGSIVGLFAGLWVDYSHALYEHKWVAALLVVSIVIFLQLDYQKGLSKLTMYFKSSAQEPNNGD